MRTSTILAVVMCLVALAAEDAVIAPREATNLKPPAPNLEMDAITIPRMLSYQGRLTDTLGSPVVDTTYSVNFRLYSVPSGGSPLWSETQTVRTRSGLFSTLLGSVTPIGSMPDAGAVYLGMAVEGGSELAPRLRIVSAAYAYKADSAGYATAAAPVGVAGGDLAGTYPDPTVDGIRGRAVASASPSTNQVLKWSGSQWVPRNDSVGVGGGGTVTSVSHSTGITCSPNPITTTGTVRLNTSYSDGRYVNTTGDSITGALAIGAPLRVHDKAALGYSCYNNGFAAFCAGYGNSASGDRASITGGEDNSAGGKYSHIGGGSENQASALWATIGGGNVNEAIDTATTIGGGRENFATASHAAVCGGYSNDATGAYSFVGGGYNNAADTSYATVAGGQINSATGEEATIGGGRNNSADGRRSTVAGGSNNDAVGEWSTVGGGNSNDATGPRSTIAGGYGNGATDFAATVAGGDQNAADSEYAAVGGGYNNIASGFGAVIPGGWNNAARARTGFAAGSFARANHRFSFVWSDSAYYESESTYTTGSNQFRVRARGGTWFFSNRAMTTGVYLAPSSNSWTGISYQKDGSAVPVDRHALLERLVTVPVREYRLDGQDESVRHIGPTAHEYGAALGYGETETGINLADADGVLLAAVQALYDEVKTDKVRIAQLEAELAQMKK